METVFLTIYVLMWPVIVGGILWTVCEGFVKDLLLSRKEGRPII
ncbi:putative transporter small subunit [Arthrobacter pigmenti]